MLKIIQLSTSALAVIDYGVYVHIPFCAQKCDYCSFYSLAMQNKTKLVDYCEQLCRNIEDDHLVAERSVCSTIYFGGGTPSLLENRLIDKILTSIKKRYYLADTCEITLECNPAQFNAVKFNELVAIGVNRFSMGIQSLDPELFTYLGRSGEMVNPTLLENFFLIDAQHCLDMIIGVRDVCSSLSSIKKIAAYSPDHISAYLLSIDKNTALKKRAQEYNLDDFQRQEFFEVSEFLESQGYHHYEISNFARSGHYSRHNLKYWQGDYYRGYGAGAHSFLPTGRISQKESIDEYCSADVHHLKESQNDEALLIEFVFTGLRTVFGVSEKGYFQRFNKRFPDALIKRARQIENMRVTQDNAGFTTMALITKDFIEYDSYVYQLLEPFLP